MVDAIRMQCIGRWSNKLIQSVQHTTARLHSCAALEEQGCHLQYSGKWKIYSTEGMSIKPRDAVRGRVSSPHLPHPRISVCKWYAFTTILQHKYTTPEGFHNATQGWHWISRADCIPTMIMVGHGTDGPKTEMSHRKWDRWQPCRNNTSARACTALGWRNSNRSVP